MGLMVLAIACSNNFSTPTSPNTPVPTATPTDTPTATFTQACFVGSSPTCTPTFTSTNTFTFTQTNTFTVTNTPTKTNTPTITNTPNGTPTDTPTVNATFTIPMGIWVAATFAGSINDLSLLAPVTTNGVNTLVTLSINHTAETSDAITLTTPSNGAIPVTYFQSSTLSGIPVAQYATTIQYTYVPSGTYSISIATSLGTITSTMAAPGAITFDATGASVTALYPGNYDSAIVTETSPSPGIAYQSPIGVDVGSPFTFPVTAFSSPATFAENYSAAMTVLSFTGTPAAGCAFVGDLSLSKYFVR